MDQPCCCLHIFSLLWSPLYILFISDGRNLSDHIPLVFSLNLSIMAICCLSIAHKPASVYWVKLTTNDILQYQNIVYNSPVTLGSSLSHDIISCCNPACTVGQNILKEICEDLVMSLNNAADSTIPGTTNKGQCRVSNWSQSVKP